VYIRHFHQTQPTQPAAAASACASEGGAAMTTITITFERDVIAREFGRVTVAIT